MNSLLVRLALNIFVSQMGWSANNFHERKSLANNLASDKKPLVMAAYMLFYFS